MIQSSIQKKRRAAFTDEQKRRVRHYVQRVPTPPHKEVIVWAKNELNISIDCSQITRWTSDVYSSLDKETLLKANAKRHRTRKWEGLEYALFEWIIQMESRITISQALLKEKARIFFQRMPQYAGEKEPAWSSGWLSNFQAQFNIKSRKRHGELGSAEEIDCEEEMEKIIEELKHYLLERQYNADETGLYWKATPDRSLSTKEMPGKKLKKDRVSVMITCNASGTKKLKPWFIGKAKKPYAFRARGINVDAFHMVWRSNKKAWMNTSIMIEYLRWFDSQMTQDVVLLLDNFKAHNAAVEFLNSGKTEPLRYTKARFFPPNVTSKHQPCDQGIISAWKAHYKRQWLRYMCEEAEAGRDPMSTMDVLKTVRWSIQAWVFDVKPETIQNCWLKSGCHGVPIGPQRAPPGWDETPEMRREVKSLITKVCEYRGIENPIDVESFLNPEDEIVQDNEEDIEAYILEMFSPEEEEEEPEVEAEEIRKITIQEALKGLNALQLWEEQSDEPDANFILRLERQKRVMRARQANTGTQSTLQGWLGIK
jgi:hypothetical protein